MTASVTFLYILVGGATIAAALIPVILLTLWVNDLRHGRLW
ncbi:MAG: hypothetical protein P8179_03110 [Candidatus Thiodiazotropha sp.]|jgi:hypothetical protein